MERSSVYHIDMLDDEQRENFDAAKPWVWESEGDLKTFATEDEACGYQRSYRTKYGFDPITGARV